MKAPCKNCDRRVIGCHSTCVDYQMFYVENEKTKQNRYDYVFSKGVTIRSCIKNRAKK